MKSKYGGATVITRQRQLKIIIFLGVPGGNWVKTISPAHMSVFSKKTCECQVRSANIKDKQVQSMEVRDYCPGMTKDSKSTYCLLSVHFSYIFGKKSDKKTVSS